VSVKQTLAYWRDAGLTPDEAMAGLGLIVGGACSWVEVEMVAEGHAKRLAEEARVTEILVRNAVRRKVA
jgi:hypothetical protein